MTPSKNLVALIPNTFISAPPRITIIGTSGAGKTVFISVLAMRFRSPTPGRPWLEFKTRETQRYVTRVWDTLDKGEWPPSTPPGTFSTLEWDFHTDDGARHTLIVRDPAGQDVRAIYDSPEEDQTEDQRELKRIFDSSNILIFLVNLRPAMDAGGNQSKIDDIEIPIKLSIQDALKNGRAVAVVATQHDLIANGLEKMGVQESDGAQAAIAHFFPQISGLLRSHTEQIGTYFVAAVADTTPMVENGIPYRRPKPGFTSEGLDDVLNWVKRQIPKATARNAQEEAERLRLARIQKEEADRQLRVRMASNLRPQLHKMGSISLVALLVAVFVFLLVKWKTFDQLYKRYYDAALVEKVESVEKERFTNALPYDEYRIEKEIPLSNESGDQYRDITFVNKSGKRLYSITIFFSWRTSFWGREMNARGSIAAVSDGGRVDMNRAVYCDRTEWAHIDYQVSCYYGETVPENHWVHDSSKDGQLTTQALQESIRWGVLGSTVGLIPFVLFGIATVRIKRQMHNLLTAGESPQRLL